MSALPSSCPRPQIRKSGKAYSGEEEGPGVEVPSLRRGLPDVYLVKQTPNLQIDKDAGQQSSPQTNI